MNIPTIKIADDSKRGWKIINEADFDAKTMTLYEEPKPEQPQEPKTEPKPDAKTAASKTTAAGTSGTAKE